MVYHVGLVYISKEHGYSQGIELKPGMVVSNIPGVEPPYIDTGADPYSVANDCINYLKNNRGLNVVQKDSEMYEDSGETIEIIFIEAETPGFVPAYAFREDVQALMNYLQQKYGGEPPETPSPPPEEPPEPPETPSPGEPEISIFDIIRQIVEVIKQKFRGVIHEYR